MSTDMNAVAVRSSNLVAMLARWRVNAAQLENSMDGQYPTDSEMAERANALRECANELEAEIGRASLATGGAKQRREPSTATPQPNDHDEH